MPTVLADDASIANTGTRFDGLDRYDARELIVAELAARGDLVDQKPHEMVIGRCQHSDDVLEPRLKTQWFIRTGPLAERALDATRSGRTRDPAIDVRDLGALAHRSVTGTCRASWVVTGSPPGTAPTGT